MPKPGRNDPCPCASGKKYKRCCLERDQAAAALPQSRTAAALAQPLGWIEDDDFDDLSNSVIDLLDDGRIEEAARACDELQKRYPELPDWMERRGQVEEARGNYAQAARHYQKAADFVEGREGYDPEVGESLRDLAAAMARKASGA